MAILLLEQEGKLSLDDDVRKYIPELPDLGKVVKIKNMLNHTRRCTSARRGDPYPPTPGGVASNSGRRVQL